MYFYKWSLAQYFLSKNGRKISVNYCQGSKKVDSNFLSKRGDALQRKILTVSIWKRSFWLLAHIYILYVEFERKLCQNKNGYVEKWMVQYILHRTSNFLGKASYIANPPKGSKQSSFVTLFYTTQIIQLEKKKRGWRVDEWLEIFKP